MKALRILHLSRSHWWVALLGFGAAATSACAAETNAPAGNVPAWTPQQMFEGGTNKFNNWVDISAVLRRCIGRLRFGGAGSFTTQSLLAYQEGLLIQNGAGCGFAHGHAWIGLAWIGLAWIGLG